MIDASSLVAIGVAFFIVAASPGPGNLASASVSLTYGRRVGLLFGAGLASGLCFWGVFAALGMGAVLQTSTIALTALKFAGAAYLLWLAFQSAKSAVKPQKLSAEDVPAGRWYLRGLAFNILNPKAVFAWMAAFSVGLTPDDGWLQVSAATLLCVVLTAINASSWAWVFSTEWMMGTFARVRRGVDGVMAVLFAATGLAMLRSALTRTPT